MPSELGSFRGNFKEAVGKLRALLGLKEGEDLGFVYDKPIGPLKDSRHTLLVCVKLCDLSVRDECAPSCHPPIHTTNPLRTPSATPHQALTKPSPPSPPSPPSHRPTATPTPRHPHFHPHPHPHPHPRTRTRTRTPPHVHQALRFGLQGSVGGARGIREPSLQSILRSGHCGCACAPYASP